MGLSFSPGPQPATADGYLPAQYRHLLRTFGKNGQTRAVFAVRHSILDIA